MTGTVSGKPGLREPGTARAGEDVDASTRAGPVILAPRDPKHQALLIYRALPLKVNPFDEEDEVEMFYSSTNELAWAARVWRPLDAFVNLP